VDEAGRDVDRGVVAEADRVAVDGHSNVHPRGAAARPRRRHQRVAARQHVIFFFFFFFSFFFFFFFIFIFFFFFFFFFIFCVFCFFLRRPLAFPPFFSFRAGCCVFRLLREAMASRVAAAAARLLRSALPGQFSPYLAPQCGSPTVANYLCLNAPIAIAIVSFLFFSLSLSLSLCLSPSVRFLLFSNHELVVGFPEFNDL
jgi:hypothetical protein